MPPTTCLITGVAGFVGSNLADRLLAEGYRVRGIDNLSQGVAEQVPAGVDFHRRDIREPDLDPLLEGVDAIFHLAAKNCIADCQADPVETTSINVLGTVNLLATAARTGVRRVIYAESSALYEGVEQLPTPEGHVAPHSFSAVSKQASMAFAEAFARFHSLEATALRYFCVYGPRQDYRRSIPPVMSAFALHLLRGTRPTIYGDGSKRRDFVHVDDINDFHLRCLRDPRTLGGTYNLGSGTSTSVLDILARLERLLGTRQAPIFVADQPGEARETLADISRARALGWEPRIDLDQGLQSMVGYLREHVLA